MNTHGRHEARPRAFTAFDAEEFPEGLAVSSAVEYLRCYLADLGAATIIEEPSYFDRDYLAEICRATRMEFVLTGRDVE